MLTQRQSEYLAFIHSYLVQYGGVPNVGKIAIAFGVNQSTAGRMVDSLCAAGELRKVGGLRPKYEMVEAEDVAGLPFDAQLLLLRESERAQLKPKLLLARIVREYCEKQR